MNAKSFAARYAIAAKCLLLIILSAAILTIPNSSGFAQPAGDEGATIVEVKFEGLQKLKAEDLLEKIQSVVGSKYDPKLISEDLKRLGSQVMEAEVRKEKVDGGVRLTFILSENPVLSKTEFIGNQKISTKDLEKIMRVKPGEVLTRDAVTKARQAVMKEYSAQGYAGTNVRAHLAKSDAGEVVLQVVVDEGKKIKINDLVIKGNEHFSSIRLRTAIETKGSWLFLKNFFDEDAFDNDLEIIKQMYQRDGYFDASVSRGEFKFDEATQVVTPIIVIVEGPRYRFGKVALVGNTFFTNEEVIEPFRRLAGKYFNGDEYGEALKKVRALYENAGYVSTEIADDINLDREKGEVNVTLTFAERHRVKVGRVLVERPQYLGGESSWFGKIYNKVAPPVEDSVIKREVVLKPGETYDKSKEEESVERLRRLGVLEDVKVESVSTGDPQVRDVLVKVQEGLTGNVLVGVGYSDSSGAYVMGNFTERNVGGEANDLRVSGMVGTRELNASISYLDRYLRGSDSSLYSEIHRSQYRRTGDYTEINTGGSSEWSKPLSDPWKLYVRGRGEFVNLRDLPDDVNEDLTENYAVAAGRVRVTHDTVVSDKLLPNSVPVPVKGHVGSAGVEAGYAGGPLMKLTGGYDWYQRLTEKAVFTTSLQGGLMPVPAKEVGLSERLYMGGTDDLRGFEFRGAGPHDKGAHDLPIGGSTKLLARNEMRYPIVDNLTGLVFVDAGMLSRDPMVVASPRASTGVGLRFTVANKAQIGVDFAAPLLTGKNDQKRWFHFSVNGLLGF